MFFVKKITFDSFDSPKKVDLKLESEGLKKLDLNKRSTTKIFHVLQRKKITISLQKVSYFAIF